MVGAAASAAAVSEVGAGVGAWGSCACPFVPERAMARNMERDLTRIFLLSQNTNGKLFKI